MSTNPEDIRLRALGQAIRDSRLEANWTQAYLATQAGVSKATLRRLESGLSVQLVNWLRILDALGLDTDSALSPTHELDPLVEVVRERSASRKQRQRASGGPPKPKPPAWPWGEDR